jgi:hypothetical protein
MNFHRAMYYLGIAAAMTNGPYWLMLFIVNQLTPVIVGSPLGLRGFFYILTVFNATSFLFVLIFLPETKVLLNFLVAAPACICLHVMLGY